MSNSRGVSPEKFLGKFIWAGVRMRRTAVHTQHCRPAGATIVEKMQVETISGDMTAARRRCFDRGVLLIH